MRVIEPIEKSGYFWLPSSPDARLPGTLTIRDEGCVELEVFGAFEIDSNMPCRDSWLGRIVGQVDMSGYVTLDDCSYTHIRTSSDAPVRSKVLVGVAVVGVLIEEQGEIETNNVSFTTDLLDEWLGITGISVKNDWDGRSTVIESNPVKDINCDLGCGLSLKIEFLTNFPVRGTISRAYVAHYARLTISSLEAKKLKVLLDAAYKLTNLLCFATNATLAAKEFSSIFNSRVDDSEEQREKHTNIFYRSPSYTEHVAHRETWEMLFRYDQIGESTAHLFRKWFDAYEEIRPAMNLYFSTANGGHKYIESRFLALIQGLETYHRKTSTETLKPEEEYSDMVNEILAGCPPDKLEWLGGRLKYGNEINLRTRIKKMIEPFKCYLGTRRQRNSVVQKIVDTRNYLTHYNDNLIGASVEGKGLIQLCDFVEGIFQLHFLQVVGFSDKDFKTALVGNEALWKKVQLRD